VIQCSVRNCIQQHRRIIKGRVVKGRRLTCEADDMEAEAHSWPDMKGMTVTETDRAAA